jgi:hypothetical protein
MNHEHYVEDKHFCKDEDNLCEKCEAREAQKEQEWHDRMEKAGKGPYYVYGEERECN